MTTILVIRRPIAYLPRNVSSMTFTGLLKPLVEQNVNFRFLEGKLAKKVRLPSLLRNGALNLSEVRNLISL